VEIAYGACVWQRHVVHELVLCLWSMHRFYVYGLCIGSMSMVHALVLCLWSMSMVYA
jgi:hypothetical protein